MVGATDMTTNEALTEQIVDPELVLEADAAVADLPPDPITETGEPVAPPVDAEKEFRDVLRMPVMFVQRAVLPQWGITDEYRDEFAEATAQCLAQLFPDGINGKYACWFRLLAVSGVITVSAIAQNEGKLPGIGPKVEKVKTGAENGEATRAA